MRCSGVAVVFWAALGGCLPEGGPGVGRQVVAERGLADVAFSREVRGGPGAYLLFTRAGAIADSGDALDRDLYLVAREGGETRLRAERLPPQVRSLYFWDDGGHLYLHRDIQRQPAAGPGMSAAVSWELLGLDPLAGGEVSLGRARLERMSPSRTRLFYQRPDGAGFVRTLGDGAERPVGPAVRQSMFIDEDLYFVDDGGLGRLAAGGDTPQPLLPEVSAFRPVTTSRGDLVVR